MKTNTTEPEPIFCPCCGSACNSQTEAKRIESIRRWQTGTEAAASLGRLNTGPRKQSPEAKRNRQIAMAKVNAMRAEQKALATIAKGREVVLSMTKALA